MTEAGEPLTPVTGVPEEIKLYPIGALAYHPYVIQIVSIDSEWSRQHDYDSTSSYSPLMAFRGACTELQNNCRRLQNESEGGTDESHDILYKLMPFVPVGHADAICMLLTDDVESLHETVSSSRTTIEEVTVGFCPQMTKLYHDVVDNSSLWAAECPVKHWAQTNETRVIFTDPPAMFGRKDTCPANIARPAIETPDYPLVVAQYPLLMLSALKLVRRS